MMKSRARALAASTCLSMYMCCAIVCLHLATLHLHVTATPVPKPPASAAGDTDDNEKLWIRLRELYDPEAAAAAKASNPGLESPTAKATPGGGDGNPDRAPQFPAPLPPLHEDEDDSLHWWKSSTGGNESSTNPPLKPVADGKEVERFMAAFARREGFLARQSALAAWSYETNMTTNNQEVLVAAAGREKQYITDVLDRASVWFANARSLAPAFQRQLNLLMLLGGQPRSLAQRTRLDRLVIAMNSFYSQAQVCEDRNGGTSTTVPTNTNDTATKQPAEGKRCLRYTPEIEAIMSNVTESPERLKAIWLGWHNAMAPMRPMYKEFVELSNQGARDYGFSDTAALWLSGYDATPAEVLQNAEAIWNDLKPLYTELHCYVRSKLEEVHGDKANMQGGLLPAHLMGNMWAQTWSALMPIVKPFKNGSSEDLTGAMRNLGWNVDKVHRVAESMYEELGQTPLPPSFWNRSMLTRPDDREVVCHASAWDFGKDPTTGIPDVRMKMCTVVRGEDLLVSAHELGHIHYFIAYANQSFLFRQGANDGFHEAIGDTIRLSATVPATLKRLGLTNSSKLTYENLINYQLGVALEKVVIMPFAYLVDKWRWSVFKGELKEEEWNKGWWHLKEDMQGVASPEPRNEAKFDPGAKYHVPANVPYFRYFLANILQFQFHEALCAAAQWNGSLHECSIFGNEAAGKKLHEMMSKGASQPWQDTLYELSGDRTMNAKALLKYFDPLLQWLKKSNAGRKCGWTAQTPAPTYLPANATVTPISPSTTAGTGTTPRKGAATAGARPMMGGLLAMVVGMLALVHVHVW